MSDIPMQIIVAAFNSPDRAGQVMDDLKQGKKEGLVGILDAAVVVKDAEGKIKVTDSKRRSTKGFITGGLIGGVVGLLAGPVGWVALGGGAIGALMGKAQGAPLKAEMKDIASALTPNSSAIVALIELKWVAQLEAQLAAEGAKVVRDEVKADIAEQLNAGGSVLYSATTGPAADGVARVTESADGTHVTGAVATGDGVYITDAQIVDPKHVDEITADGSAPGTAKP